MTVFVLTSAAYILKKNVTICGDRVFKEITRVKSSHKDKGWGLNRYDCVFMRGGRHIKDISTKKRPCGGYRKYRHGDDHVKTQQEGSHLQAKERGLDRTQTF